MKQRNPRAYVLAIVEPSNELTDGWLETNVIVMSEHTTLAGAERERNRRQALVNSGHWAHQARQYLSITRSDYVAMINETRRFE